MGRRENNIKTGSSGRGKTSGDSFKGRGKGSRKNSAAGSRNFSKDDRTDFRKSSASKSAFSDSRGSSASRSRAEYNDYEKYSSKRPEREFSSFSKIIPHYEIVVGFHAIEETLKEGSIEAVLYVSGKGKRHEKITALAVSRNIKVSKVSDEYLTGKSPDIDPRGVVLEVTGKKEAGKYTSVKAFLDQIEKNGTENALVLILDSITDPHNLGAILRSADQLNVNLVVLPGRRSAGDNATVRKISSGASEYVPQAVENLSRAADMLKKCGFWIYAADMGGEESWNLNLKGRTALILGSEGSGVSKILTDKSDSIIRIPASGHVDSFNVSVAAGILMYEAVRQMNKQ